MAATKTDTLNYRGELFLTAQNSTPFLREVLANGSRFGAFEYNESVESAVGAGAQNPVSEDASVTGTTAVTATKTPSTNICQIDMRGVEVSFAKFGETYSTMSGLNNSQEPSRPDELAFQQSHTMKKLVKDYEFSLLQGTYAGKVDTATATATRGITSKISTNSVDASSAALSTSLVDSTLLEMYNNGAEFGTVMAVCRPEYKQQLDKLYGTQPESRTEGGVNLQTYYTSLTTFNVLYTVNAPANTILFLDMDYIFAHWNIPDFSQVQSFAEEKGARGLSSGDIQMYDVDENGNVFNGLIWIPKLSTGASVGGWFYSHFGGDYGSELMHGKLINLA